MTASPSWRDLLLEHWHLARTLRCMEIIFDPERCVGLWECYQVCPVDCWKPDYQRGVVTFIGAERCIACNACVLQCSAEAIDLKAA
jgi:NAD-dependent dihydropyrimidine dehydrogenase PreA subunit